MRVASARFFSSIAGDDLILHCYRLADRYKQNPDIFIDMPITRLMTHLRYTIALTEVQNVARQQRSDDDDDA
jgi:hypothetical protein